MRGVNGNSRAMNNTFETINAAATAIASPENRGPQATVQLFEDYTVMVIYGRMGDLAYSKPGYKAWTKINSKGLNLDLTYYKGKLYAINMYGRIMACDVRVDNPTVAQVANMPHNISHPTIPQVATYVPPNISHLDKVFIVESLGRLLVVLQGLRGGLEH
ncbi:hypothetical protein EZV62_023049 [Acer yangbiense]|uniref:KIB1-4 beta-propeller domain-containing protein n=1 Tax=Acer yangbiense TaxID=1000413 RepID=A0A5C7H185_9ROSI|nr:hypothetical protein EZV62_023049 [Acer yangbiense]